MHAGCVDVTANIHHKAFRRSVRNDSRPAAKRTVVQVLAAVKHPGERCAAATAKLVSHKELGPLDERVSGLGESAHRAGKSVQLSARAGAVAGAPRSRSGKRRRLPGEKAEVEGRAVMRYSD